MAEHTAQELPRYCRASGRRRPVAKTRARLLRESKRPLAPFRPQLPFDPTDRRYPDEGEDAEGGDYAELGLR